MASHSKLTWALKLQNFCPAGPLGRNFCPRLGAGNGDGKLEGEGLRTGAAEAVEEKVDTWTYVFGKPGELDRDLAKILESLYGALMQQV